MYLRSWRSLSGLSKDIWILSLSTLVNRMGTMALPFLVLFLTEHQGYSKTEAGLIVTIYGIGAIFSAPLAGRLSDHWGPKIIIQLSLFLSGFFLLLFPWVSGLTALSVLTFLWGTVNEAYRPASMVVVAQVATPAQQKPAFSLYRLSINLGMSVGPVLGGFLAPVSFDAIFYIDGLTAIAAALFITRLSATVSPEPNPPPEPQRFVLFSDRKFTYFLLATLPVMIVFFQHEAAMPLYIVRDLGLSVSTYGLLFPINTLLIILLEVPLNSAMALWPHARAIALGSFLTGLGFGAMAYAGSFSTLAITVVIWTFGEMILLPACAAFVSDIAPVHKRGSYMGLYAMTFGVAFAVGPGLGSFVLEEFGGKAVWLGAFAFGLISTLMARKFAN